MSQENEQKLTEDLNIESEKVEEVVDISTTNEEIILEDNQDEQKIVGEKMWKNLSESGVSEFDDEEMTIVHFITTESADRYGDVVRADGMNDKNYSKNPVVLFGHDHNSFPIGKSLWRKSTLRDGVKGVLAKTKFAKTEDGKIAYSLWKDGFLNSASIGFIPKDYDMILKSKDNESGGYDFKSWELLEYSIVTVPANAEALRLAYTKSINAPKIHRTFEDLMLKSLEAKVDNIETELGLALEQLSQYQVYIKDISERVEKIETEITEKEINNQELNKATEIIANISLSDDLAKSLVRDAIRGVIKGGI